MSREEIPVWEKYVLTIEEASRYFGIGVNKLRRIVDENQDAAFVLRNGNRNEIKRKMFEQFVDNVNCI